MRCARLLVILLMHPRICSAVSVAQESDPTQVRREKIPRGGDLQPILDQHLPNVRSKKNSLSDVVDFLADFARIHIFVDWTALNSAGVDREAPVTWACEDVKMSDALIIILEKAGGMTFSDPIDLLRQNGGNTIDCDWDQMKKDGVDGDGKLPSGVVYAMDLLTLQLIAVSASNDKATVDFRIDGDTIKFLSIAVKMPK